MAINTITWADKSNINTSSVAENNKITSSNMNQIKTVVNANANLQGDLANLATTEKSSLVGAINETMYNIITDGNETRLNYKIDGSWVYAKRFTLPSLASGTTIAHGLSDFVLQDYKIMTLATGVYRKLNYTTTSNYYVVDIDDTNIKLYTNGSLSGTGNITLYYTKTS